MNFEWIDDELAAIKLQKVGKKGTKLRVTNRCLRPFWENGVHGGGRRMIELWTTGTCKSVRKTNSQAKNYVRASNQDITQECGQGGPDEGLRSSDAACRHSAIQDSEYNPLMQRVNLAFHVGQSQSPNVQNPAPSLKWVRRGHGEEGDGITMHNV